MLLNEGTWVYVLVLGTGRLPVLKWFYIVIGTEDSFIKYLIKASNIFFNIYIALTVIIIRVASYFFSETKPEVEKKLSLIVWFQAYEDARHTFDVRFYVIAILFIILI
jgi:hypothetical protein